MKVGREADEINPKKMKIPMIYMFSFHRWLVATTRLIRHFLDSI